MALKEIYVSIEERYYALMDWLQAKGVPAVDWFVTPIEDKGIPSLPVFVLLVALLGAGAFFVLQDVASPKTALTVTVMSGDEPIQDALVHLTVDDKSFDLKTDKNGVAKFTGLPVGKKALVQIKEAGYADYGNEVLVTGAQSFTALLEPATSEANRIALAVTNADGQPLEAASVVYTDTAGNVKELATDATGSAFIEFAGVSDIFNIRVSRDGFVSDRVTCFASQKQCSLALSPDGAKPKDEGGSAPSKGSILVTVEDDGGIQLEGAHVIVHDADSSNVITEGVTDSQGTVFFDSAAEAGTRVYVVVEPPSDAYAGYNGAAANDVQGVASETYVEFKARLQRKTAADLRNVNVKVTGDAGQSIEGAYVRFLMADAPLRELASCNTDTHGECVLEVSSKSAGYLTIYAEGYLPHIEKNVVAGDSKTIALEALVAGNSGTLDIVVLDADGKRVELASVELVTGDGFSLGVPSQETGYDGFVSFAGLPLEEIKAYATAGSVHGYSDITKITLEARESPLELKLPAPYGRIFVNATDMTTGNLLTATVKAFEEGATSASATCATGTSPLNSTCSLKVRSDRKIVLKATAGGFADYESEQISVDNEGSVYYELRMLPTSQAKQLQVVDFRLEPLNGGEAVGSLDRGRYYLALLTLNIPGGVERGGAYLRIGDNTTLDADAAYISYFDKPQDAEITWGGTYDAESACTDEVADNASDSHVKWVQQEYSSFGVKTLAVKVFVSPNATRKSKVSFHYRAYAKKADVWYRTPEDTVLGYAESTAAKEGCRAKTTDAKYDVNEGGSLCTENACMIITLNTTTEKGANGLTVGLGHSFTANVAVRVFGDVSVPTVRIRSLGGALQFIQANNSDEWSAGVALDDAGEGSVATDVRAVEPSDFARMQFELTDAGRTLLSDERYVIVEGTGSMVVAVKPATMESGTKADLTATVFSSTGSAITDARVAIEEGTGEPFSGEANGDYAIQGDGTDGKGKEGKYTFKRLLPVSPGTFDVVASKQGYEDARATVRVSATDFLSYAPDISAISMTCDAKAVTIENSLKTDVTVSAAFSGTACVSLAGSRVTSSGDDRYTIVIPGGKSTQVVMTPIRSDQCYLVFTTTLESTGSTDSQTAWIKVECAALKKNTTTGNEKCSSAACKECTEQQCLNLNKTGGYCLPQYAKTADGKDAFLACAQPSPSPSPSPSPNATCSAKRCDLCNESACNVLQNNGSCYANYDVNTHVFTSCVSFRQDQCSPANFDLSNMLARRLGQYHAQQLFNPSTRSRYVAGSMEDQFVLVPGVGWTGNGPLPSSGEATIKINSLFPVAGVAFSIQNLLGADTQLLVNWDNNKNKCFVIRDIEHDFSRDLGLSALINKLQDAVTGTLVPANQYRSYLVLFNPKEGCAVYKPDENGQLRIEPLVDSVTLTLQSSGVLGSASRKIKISVESNDDETAARYAFMIVPMSGNVYRRGTDANNIKEPFLFVNNNPTLHMTVTGGGSSVTIDPKKAGMLALTKEQAKTVTVKTKEFTGAIGFDLSGRFENPKGTWMQGDVIGNLKTTEAPAPEAPAAPASTTETASGKITATGQLGGEGGGKPGAGESPADAEALECTGTNYCDQAKYDAASRALNDELNGLFAQQQMDTPKADTQGIVKGTADVFQKALNDAIADYMAQATTYQACLKLGKDPLKSMKESCSQQMTQPPGYMSSYSDSMYGSNYVPVSYSPTYNFGDVYGDAFRSAACNSQLLNYAFGASGTATQQQFWPSVKNSLTASMYPTTGAVNVKTPLYSNDLHVLVPMKLGGLTAKGKGGIHLVDFAYDPAAGGAGIMGGEEKAEIIDYIDGTPWDGVMVSGGFFGTAPTPQLSSVLVSIQGGGTSTNSPPISFPYVKSDGSVGFDLGTPNCFTANKYSELTKGVLQGCTITGSSADALHSCLVDEKKSMSTGGSAACEIKGDEKALEADNCVCQ
ncbi:Carboxypeptidase regulatory-like domain protein [Candidatus Norongarragalina meridionalis]|nr:Carboxypeptidase regulatory-like domain protein [Candidatus Norongarragalina meridionalis]